MKYPYTARNLLSGEPYHYMYTPFEGQQLIESYISDRERCLVELSIFANHDPQATAVLVWQQSSVEHPHSTLGATWPFEKNVVDSVTVLRDLVLTLANDEAPFDRAQVYFINELARKFEVSKRLRRGYDRNYKATDMSASAQLDAYAYLAFLIFSISPHESDLRHHNVLLKLNDLVCSADVASMSALAKAALKRTINYELEITKNLLFKVGVVVKEKNCK